MTTRKKTTAKEKPVNQNQSGEAKKLIRKIVVEAVNLANGKSRSTYLIEEHAKRLQEITEEFDS